MLSSNYFVKLTTLTIGTIVNDGTGIVVVVGAIVTVTVIVNGLMVFPDVSDIVPKLAKIPVGIVF
jgi:hypothetical protein